MKKSLVRISVVVAAVAGVFIGHGLRARLNQPLRLKVDVSVHQPIRGPEDAAITIVEFGDFECPFCASVNPTIETLFRDYGQRVRLVWRHNPLSFHKQAGVAAQAAAEAFAQGGSAAFWKMHALILENQKALTRPDLERHARQIGLDLDRFRRALDTQAHQAIIEQDLQLAERLGVRSTPAFFVNGLPLTGAQPLDRWKLVIDHELERVDELLRAGTPSANLYAELMKDGQTVAQGSRPRTARTAAPAPGQTCTPGPAEPRF
jgi:protein-disulfide isomerase